MSVFIVAFTALLAITASANPFAPKSLHNPETAYISNLLRAATPTANSQIRHLAENVDISAYSMRYERCQYIQGYDDDEAKSSSTTVLATSQFVIFRLCPAGTCSSCSSNYGEYLVDLKTYLYYTVQFVQNNQTTACNYCNACPDATDTTYVDCSTCTSECDKINNMNTYGYVDATKFLTCTLIYDPDDDSNGSLYAKPTCASQGGKIKIGVFTDANCEYQDESKSVDSYLVNEAGTSMKLSHSVLKNVYDSSSCFNCSYTNNGNTQVADVCKTPYVNAAKCEASNGFTSGLANYEGYENQVAQEALVCNYIKSITAGTYSEQGEIVVSGSKSVNGARKANGGQRFALTFFILGTAGLAAFAAMLHQKITKGGKSLSVAHQDGGALA